VLVTNRNPKNALTTTIALSGFAPKAEVKVQVITGDTFMAENSYGTPDAVTLKDTNTAWNDGMTYTFPPCSLTCLTFKVE
jgi:alpha-L-arabinofuranosidase